MISGPLKALALLAVALLTSVAQPRVPTGTLTVRDQAFVPRPEVAKVSAFGFDALIGDYYWLKAVQVVGAASGLIETKGALLGALIDVVTTLDPWVDHPYRFAAVWLVADEAAVRKANDILRRGIAHHPGDWRNRFYLGFNLFFYLDDYEESAEVLEEAMGLPGAPTYLRRLVARLKARGESLGLAASFLQGLLLEARSDEERAQYEAALGEIQTERLARTLDEARERYEERHGCDIEDVEDLTRGPDPVLAELPREPQGGGWKLDPSTGRIVSDVLRHRYEAKIDAVNRKKVERVREKVATEGEG